MDKVFIIFKPKVHLVEYPEVLHENNSIFEIKVLDELELKN